LAIAAPIGRQADFVGTAHAMDHSSNDRRSGFLVGLIIFSVARWFKPVV
jgi:hypothetical protein